MTNSIKGGIAFAKAHPTRDGKTWDQWCASFVYRFFYVEKISGSWRDTGGRSATTAYNAYKVTKAMGQIFGGPHDTAKAPAGAVFYWAFSKDNPGAGHIAIATQAGGKGLYMASNRVHKKLGLAMGITNVDDYTDESGLYLLGWGTFMGQSLTGTVLDPRKAASAAQKAKAAKEAQLAKAAAAATAKKAAAVKAAQEAAAKAAAEKKAAAVAEAKHLAALLEQQQVTNIYVFVGVQGKPERFSVGPELNTLHHIDPDSYRFWTSRGYKTNMLRPEQLAGYTVIDYKH